MEVLGGGAILFWTIKEELTYEMTLERELEGSEGDLGEECPWQKDQQVQRPWEQEGG